MKAGAAAVPLRSLSTIQVVALLIAPLALGVVRLPNGDSVVDRVGLVRWRVSTLTLALYQLLLFPVFLSPQPSTARIGKTRFYRLESI